MKLKLWVDNEKTLEFEDVDPAFSIDEQWGFTISISEVGGKLGNTKIKPHLVIYSNDKGESLFEGTIEDFKQLFLNEKNRCGVKWKIHYGTAY